MNATWLIGALFEFFTRVLVRFVADVPTPHPLRNEAAPEGAALGFALLAPLRLIRTLGGRLISRPVGRPKRLNQS